MKINFLEEKDYNDLSLEYNDYIYKFNLKNRGLTNVLPLSKKDFYQMAELKNIISENNKINTDEKQIEKPLLKININVPKINLRKITMK